MTEMDKQQMLDIVEELAREWDGCEADVHAVGLVDIGDAIRRSGLAKVHAVASGQGPSPAQKLADFRASTPARRRDDVPGGAT